MAPPIRVTSDSGSGELPAKQTVNTNPGTGQQVVVVDDSEIPRFQNALQAQKSEFEELQANKDKQAKNIKFLGSSYSGVDIKVVAHLYDSVNRSGEKEELETQRAIAQRVVDGATSLLTGGISGLVFEEALNPGGTADYSLRRELFIASTGLPVASDEPTQTAITILVANIFTPYGNFTTRGSAQMQSAASEIKNVYEAQVNSLTIRIEELEQIGAESSDTVVLGSLQTISVQSFREKHAVRACGHTFAKGYSRGTRTIGGSMIFTIFQEHALLQLIRSMGKSKNYGERDHELTTLIPDQLPPIDITLVFANEYGSLSDMRLYGVEFVADGQVMSIEDLLMEGTMNFVCREADMLTYRGRIGTSRKQRGMFNGKDDKDTTGSSLLFNNNDYNQFLDRLGVRRRLTNR